MTSASLSAPLILRQDFSASSASWYTIDMALNLEKAPFTFFVRCRSVEKVDSMALVVRTDVNPLLRLRVLQGAFSHRCLLHVRVATVVVVTVIGDSLSPPS